MNYYDARQRQDNKRWDYTRMNDGHISPVGYCGDADHAHDTAEAARECFARYLLDGWREENYGNWAGCAVCDVPTKKGLTTRPPLGHGYPLCDEHRTLEQLKQLAPTDAGQITASY